MLHGAVDIERNYPTALIFLGIVHSARGDFAEAIRWMERSVAANPHPVFNGHLGLVYGQAGRKEDASRVLTSLTEQSKTGYVAAINFAFLHLGLGNMEEWCQSMHAAVRDREPLLTVLGFPWFDNVRSTTQFRKIVQQVGLPASVVGTRNAAV